MQDVLNSFDIADRKGFDDHDVIAALQSVDEEEKTKPSYAFETLAFRLVPSSHDNPWGFYFGPQFTYADANGTPIYSPAFDEITVDAIDYWIKRCNDSVNPLLKMRYSGLVWDFEQKIAHRGHPKDLYRVYVDSMLKVCNEDYCSHPVITTNTLERLFIVAKGQEADLASTKAVYASFESKHADDDSVRYWASQFLLMIEYKKHFTQPERERLVAMHEARLTRLSAPNNEGRVNPWLVQSQGDLLAKYYNTIQDKENGKRVLRIVEKAFLNEDEFMSPMQLLGNLQQVHQTYLHYGFTEEASRLSTILQKLGEKAKEEMQPYSYEFEIPKEVYQQADSMFGVQVVVSNAKVYQKII